MFKDSPPPVYVDPEVQAARLDEVLRSDAPEPSAVFDAELDLRLEALRATEREEQAHCGEVAGSSGDDALDGLLSLDQPTPGPDFDVQLQFKLRRELALDSEMRLPPVDVLRVPRLPQHNGPLFERASRPHPFTRARKLKLAGAAVVALALSAVLGDRLESSLPPDEDLALVAHLDLVEAFEEVSVFDALQDEETFEVVSDVAGLFMAQSAAAQPAAAPAEARSAGPDEPTSRGSRYAKFTALNPETQQEVRERWRQFRGLAKEDREAIRADWKRYQALAVKERRIVRENFERWARLKPQKRHQVQKLFKRFMDMGPPERERFMKNLSRFREWPPEEREKVKEQREKVKEQREADADDGGNLIDAPSRP